MYNSLCPLTSVSPSNCYLQLNSSATPTNPNERIAPKVLHRLNWAAEKVHLQTQVGSPSSHIWHVFLLPLITPAAIHNHSWVPEHRLWTRSFLSILQESDISTAHSNPAVYSAPSPFTYLSLLLLKQHHHLPPSSLPQLTPSRHLEFCPVHLWGTGVSLLWSYLWQYSW